jgi:predicted DNA-binding transcriptional regulator AlpA
MEQSNTLLRYVDLQRRGIVRNRQQLSNLIHDYGFPAGWLLTPNARVWDESDVEAWLAERRGHPLHAQPVNAEAA